MRVLTVDEMMMVSGGHYTDKDGGTHLDTISISRDGGGNSDSSGGGRDLGKKTGIGTWQNGTVETRRIMDAKTGKIHWEVFDSGKHIFNATDERTLMEKLTNEFGPKFGGFKSRWGER